jgi:hypothetical protein
VEAAHKHQQLLLGCALLSGWHVAKTDAAVPHSRRELQNNGVLLRHL